MNKPNLFTKSFVVDGAAILILAVILRLVFSINSGANPEERRLADDSKGYLELAQNLNKGLGFGRYFDTNAVQANSTQTNLDQTNSVPASASSLTWVPEYCRTPGYPWILSVCARDPDRIPAAAVPLQQAIELLIWFTVFSVCYLYFGRVPGILAGILAALDLQGIALSNMLFSEITFTVVLVASVFTAARMLKERGAAWAAVTGLLGGEHIYPADYIVLARLYRFLSGCLGDLPASLDTFGHCDCFSGNGLWADRGLDGPEQISMRSLRANVDDSIGLAVTGRGNFGKRKRDQRL